MNKKHDIIPAIHNYCDRWCERCAFSERCAVGLAESKRNTKETERDWGAEIRENFNQLLSTIDELLKKSGLDPKEIRTNPLPELDPDVEILSKKMSAKTLRYFTLTRDFFKKNDSFFEEKICQNERQADLGMSVAVDELMQIHDSFSTIHWFSGFIGAKASRAISGLEDWNDWGDPLQSDANGSAKICQIAIGRSLGAWKTILSNFPEKTNEMLDVLVQLRDIQRDMQHLFPDWKKFHRPGFDDEPSFAKFALN